MASELRKMIARQGDALRAVARFDLDEAADRIRGASRVLVTGTGTSQHAAELGARLLNQAGIDAASASAAQAARWSPACRPGEAVIVISHTGETAYARSVRQHALDTGVAMVSITGPAAGWPEAVTTAVKETSETYTVSYVSAVAILAKIAWLLGAPGSGPGEIEQVAGRVDVLAADPGIGAVPMPERAMAIVGAGPWHVTAREGALKLREASHVICDGFDAELLLHGSAVPYGPGDVLVALQPDADPDGLVAGLAAAAADAGMAVATLEEPALPVSDVLAQIPLTVRLQSLAADFAERRQTNPDVVITGSWTREQLWKAGAPTW